MPRVTSAMIGALGMIGHCSSGYVPDAPDRASVHDRGLRSAPLLDVPQQTLLARDLAIGEHVLLVLVRVVAFLEDETHRRSDQLEALAEEVFQVALVAIGQGTQTRAMDDEGRRVLAARMGEAQLGDVASHNGWRIGLIGRLD